MVDAILKIKDTARPVEQVLADLAAFAVVTFGKGGNPGAEKVEDYLGFINTPVQGGHLRIRIDDEYASALEQIELNGGNPLAGLVRIQEITDNTPFMVDVETVDENGNSAIISVELGGF